MKESLLGHELPANKSASKLLWRSPWWAKSPPEIRRKSSELAKRMTVEEMVNVTSPPPETVTDRRGTLLQWRCGKIGVITGFAGVKEKRKNLSVGQKMRKRPPYWVGKWDTSVKVTRAAKINLWWAFADGEYFEIKWDHRNGRRFTILKDNHE